jgi:hypothetical protein
MRSSCDRPAPAPHQFHAFTSPAQGAQHADVGNDGRGFEALDDAHSEFLREPKEKTAVKPEAV